MSDRAMPDGFKPVFRRANVANRKRVRALERRHEYLLDLIRQRKARDFDKAEAKALEWAIPITRDWMDADPVFDVEVAPEEFDGDLQEWVALLGTATRAMTEQGPRVCEIVGVNLQDRRLALRLDDRSRPLRKGALDDEIFWVEGASDERVSL